MDKPSLGKRIGWRLETVAYDIVSLLLKPFSFDQISAFGAFIVGLIGPLTSKQKIARKGLETAFPGASEDELKTLLKAQWKNTGRTFAEFPVLHRLNINSGDGRITVIGGEKLDALKESGTPAVFISGHFANWEIMAMVLTQWGLPSQITYRPINNPHIDKRVRTEREEAYGTKFLVPKSGVKGAKQLMEALKNGESVALMNDQKFNQGIAVPFFGVDAMTAPGPTRLAIGANAPLIPMSLEREKAKFTVTVHDPIKLKNTGDRSNDVSDGVAQISEFIENQIRKTPDQWFWVHRRWPKDHYR